MIFTVRGPVRKLCPYAAERDEGTATLTFRVTSGDAPELHNLSGLLAKGEDQAISHEDYTRGLYAEWQPRGCVRVETTWHTAGLEVRCVVPGEPDQQPAGA